MFSGQRHTLLQRNVPSSGKLLLSGWWAGRSQAGGRWSRTGRGSGSRVLRRGPRGGGEWSCIGLEIEFLELKQGERPMELTMVDVRGGRRLSSETSVRQGPQIPSRAVLDDPWGGSNLLAGNGLLADRPQARPHGLAQTKHCCQMGTTKKSKISLSYITVFLEFG